MERRITYYEDAKQDNTMETFRLAAERMEELGLKKLVLASTTGRTALKAMEYFKDQGIQLVVIPHQFGFTQKALFSPEILQTLKESGHEVHFGTMLFHTDKLFGNDVPTVVANFLRCFSEGFKVCYEITMMATDAGLLVPGERVVAIAGTGKGSDTSLVMQAASSRALNRLRINEILCKPLNEVADPSAPQME